MLENGVIEPSRSAWSSPVVVVKKKYGSYRFCIDFRKVDEVTEKDAYPLPHITATLDKLRGAWYLSTGLKKRVLASSAPSGEPPRHGLYHPWQRIVPVPGNVFRLTLTSNTTQLSFTDYNQTLHIDKTQKNIEPLFFYFSGTRFLGVETTPIKPQAN